MQSHKVSEFGGDIGCSSLGRKPSEPGGVGLGLASVVGVSCWGLEFKGVWFLNLGGEGKSFGRVSV